MTTLYRPVLIESAEQAEALPVGTIAIVGEPPFESSVKWDDRLWYSGRDFNDGAPSRSMVGALALVPTEAEEETRGGPIGDDWDWDDGPASPPAPTLATRLVTPWEEA